MDVEGRLNHNRPGSGLGKRRKSNEINRDRMVCFGCSFILVNTFIELVRMIIKIAKKATMERREAVSERFLSEAMGFEKNGLHKQAAICFERAVPLVDDVEGKALILYYSFLNYERANDYRNARTAIAEASRNYSVAGEEEAAQKCLEELGSLPNDAKVSLRINKGIRSVLRGCFTDNLF